MNYDSSILFGFYLYRRVIISNRIVSNDVTGHYIYCYHPLHILLSPLHIMVFSLHIYFLFLFPDVASRNRNHSATEHIDTY